MRRGELHNVLTPESIALLAAALGPGKNIYVPQYTADADSFAVLIGAEQTSRLVERLGGSKVYLPGLRPFDGRKREPTLAQVAELTRAGKSCQAIATEFGCSARSVAYKRERIVAGKVDRPPIISPIKTTDQPCIEETQP